MLASPPCARPPLRTVREWCIMCVCAYILLGQPDNIMELHLYYIVIHYNWNYNGITSIHYIIISIMDLHLYYIVIHVCIYTGIHHIMYG